MTLFAGALDVSLAFIMPEPESLLRLANKILAEELFLRHAPYPQAVKFVLAQQYMLCNAPALTQVHLDMSTAAHSTQVNTASLYSSFITAPL